MNKTTYVYARIGKEVFAYEVEFVKKEKLGCSNCGFCKGVVKGLDEYYCSATSCEEYLWKGKVYEIDRETTEWLSWYNIKDTLEGVISEKSLNPLEPSKEKDGLESLARTYIDYICFSYSK